MKRSPRHHRHRTPGGRLSPWAIAGICVGAAILLTIIVGNLLTVWLDDETYDRLTAKSTEEEEVAPLVKTEVGNVNAYPYAFGEPLETVLDLPAVSLSLNRPDGSMCYTSAVSGHQGLTGTQTDLKTAMAELTAYTSYVSGVYYSQAYRQTSADLQFAVAAEEGALLREILSTGGKEVILTALPFSSVPHSELVEYVGSIKRAVGDRGAVGVSIPLWVAQSANGWEIIGALLSACDFCVLDVTDISTEGESPAMTPEALLKEADYCLTQYDMRLMLTDRQTALLELVELRLLADYQVITTPVAAPAGNSNTP